MTNPGRTRSRDRRTQRQPPAPRIRTVWSIVLLCLGGAAARAGTVTDQPAALITFPYLVVNGAQGIDTFLQITNTAPAAVHTHCFLEDGNSHCMVDPTQMCQTSADCPAHP